jgi:hypothetical protein
MLLDASSKCQRAMFVADYHYITKVSAVQASIILQRSSRLVSQNQRATGNKPKVKKKAVCSKRQIERVSEKYQCAGYNRDSHEYSTYSLAPGKHAARPVKAGERKDEQAEQHVSEEKDQIYDLYSGS